MIIVNKMGGFSKVSIANADLLVKAN